MPKKEKLVSKLLNMPMPKDFTTRELDALMKKCNCKKYQGGRGSGIAYVHANTKRVLQFDQPHPGNELYGYQLKMVIRFLKEIDEI